MRKFFLALILATPFAMVWVPLGIVMFCVLLAGLMFVRSACPYCGKLVKMGMGYCHHCGRDVYG